MAYYYSLVVYLFSISAILKLSEGANILAFFPISVPSHHRAYQPLIMGLLAKGHRVTYFSPIPIGKPTSHGDNYTEILMKDYLPSAKIKMSKMIGMEEKEENLHLQGVMFQQQIMILIMKQFGLIMGEFVLRDEDFRTLIESDSKFDCILYGGTFMQEMFVALSHRYQAPIVEVHPSGNFHYTYWLHGNPYDTSYIVDFTIAYGDKMTLLQRAENTFNSLLIRSLWYLYYWPKYEDMMNKEFRYPGWESRPSMQEMMSDTSMVLMNSHYSLNYPYPMSPNFKEIGGINILQKEPLPKDIQEYMDSATDGVIYFTLGSHISVSSTLARGGLEDAFSKAFSKVKQKVLWKWEQDFPGFPPNVKISKWFPQQDILGHKNCKLFITHGGFLSQTESVYNGVPMIGIPMMADQMKNVNHMDHHQYGLFLRFDNLTEESISWAIAEAINNPKYSRNVKRHSAMFRDKPETALETAVYWTEYVIRHKGAHHLRPAIATMPWYQQAMIDVYLTLAIIILMTFVIIYYSLKTIFTLVCYLCCSKSSSKDKTSKKKRH